MAGFTAILISRESPIRGETFVTRKNTRAVARIKLGTDAESGEVRADLQDQGREAYLRDGGYEVKRYHE